MVSAKSVKLILTDVKRDLSKAVLVLDKRPFVRDDFIRLIASAEKGLVSVKTIVKDDNDGKIEQAKEVPKVEQAVPKKAEPKPEPAEEPEPEEPEPEEPEPEEPKESNDFLNF